MSVKNQTRNEREQSPPLLKLVKLDKAFKLAMHWVDNMSGSWDDEPNTVELQARPLRVGLGAEILQKSEFRQHNNDRTEWKLRAILDPRRRKASNEEERTTNVKIQSCPIDGKDEEDDESESRCNAFSKRSVGPPPASSASTNHKRRKTNASR